ncbi:MAG: adenylate/guanylate cyclase [Comamonadaceae bacterium]|nr:MAG: adenylate/guanylate cyclase [Comamonadaceae bacterium]
MFAGVAVAICSIPVLHTYNLTPPIVSTVLDQGNRTFIGSVLFLDIVGYTKKSVSAQIAMKDRFTSLLSASLKDIAPDQRIILDTGDGAAITFLGDPEDALFVAMQLRDALRRPNNEAPVDTDSPDASGEIDLPIRTGINLGPVKLVRDINGQPNIVGDGINVAQRIMSFAPARQIVVSRSFYDMVSVISEEYARLFTYEGSRTDKHVRDHEIYVVGESAAAFKQAQDGMTDRAATTNSRAKVLKIEKAQQAAGEAALGSASKPASHQDNKSFFIAAGVLAAVVVGLGTALIMKGSGEKTSADMAASTAAVADVPLSTASATMPASAPSKVASMAASASKPAQTPASAVTPTSASVSAPKLATKEEAAPADVPGVLTFGIQPWGEVFINGKSVGVSPPLKQTKLAPGQYSVEVRNTSLPTFTTRIDIKAKENLNISHKF